MIDICESIWPCCVFGFNNLTKANKGIFLPNNIEVSTVESNEKASLSGSDVRLTGDQEVAGLSPTKSATFFHGYLINIFYGHSLLSADSRRAVVSFWQ